MSLSFKLKVKFEKNDNKKNYDRCSYRCKSITLQQFLKPVYWMKKLHEMPYLAKWLYL